MAAFALQIVITQLNCTILTQDHTEVQDIKELYFTVYVKSRHISYYFNRSADLQVCCIAVAFPIFFGDKYPDKSAKMSVFRIFQHAIMGNAIPQDFFLCGREWNCHELFPTAVIMGTFAPVQ